MRQFLNFKNDILRLLDEGGLGEPVAKSLHYTRNDNQRSDITYYEVITSKSASGFTYALASNATSALHRFGPDNETNAKWVKADDGSEEYVFRYIGSPLSGQFAVLTEDQQAADSTPWIVRDDRNVGTYNFASAKTDPAGHLALDIFPWIMWGNSAYDASTWTRADRFDAFIASLGGGGYLGLTELIDTVTLTFTQDDGAIGSFLELIGFAQDDQFSGSEDVQEFRGRRGTDTVDYSAAPGAVTVSLDRGADDAQGFDGWARGDTFVSIENLIGSEYGDILVGNSSDNVFFGGDGADILGGGAGDDVLDGGDGANTIFGDDGDDTIYVGNTDTSVDGGAGQDTIIALFSRFSVDTALYTNVEAYRLSEDINGTAYLLGSARGETLVGNSNDNYIYGHEGDDVLFGLGGDDGLYGGAGNDTYVFEAGWGRDWIEDEGGRDTLEFLDHNRDELRIYRDIGVNGGFLRIESKTSDDKISVWNHFLTPGARVEKLVFKDGVFDLSKGLEMEGTSGYDAIQGTRFSDALLGLDGDDILRGYGGRDLIEGGAGDDILEGGAGNDTYVFRPGFGHDVISESGVYNGEPDSSGDVVALIGIQQSSVQIETDSQGRQTISVLDALGNVSDSIFIYQESQSSNGLLVEWISFDNGALMPLIDTA